MSAPGLDEAIRRRWRLYFVGIAAFLALEAVLVVSSLLMRRHELALDRGDEYLLFLAVFAAAALPVVAGVEAWRDVHAARAARGQGQTSTMHGLVYRRWRWRWIWIRPHLDVEYLMDSGPSGPRSPIRPLWRWSFRSWMPTTSPAVP